VQRVPTRTALMVLARDPGGHRTGRKAVLASAADSLEQVGLRVEVAALARAAPAPRWQGRGVAHVPLPRVGRVALSAPGAALGLRTLNEALFDAPATRRAVAAIARATGASLVVADTLRTWGPAAAAGLPVVMHLDDLLSDRYRRLARRADAADVLGYYRDELPPALVAPAGAAARRLLRWEAGLAARREVAVARRAAATAVTSEEEADLLAGRAGVPVVALPMAVAASAVPADVPRTPPASAVFLGSLHYGPNLGGVRWWRDRVRPELDALGGGDVALTVVGDASAEHRRELADGRLRFTGYVDDVHAELARHRVFAGAVPEGGGVSTKILDAFAAGIPVVATRQAVRGLAVIDGEHAWLADDPRTFAERLLRARDDPAAAARVAASGRALLAGYSATELTARWGRIVADVLGD